METDIEISLQNLLKFLCAGDGGDGERSGAAGAEKPAAGPR